jgi:hypothetical protein
VVESPEPELHCPTCRYNLTGLVEPRCPECGNPFDIDALRRAQHEPVRLIVDTRSFFTYIFGALWQPARLARSFPPHHSRAEAWCISAYAYGVAALLFVGGALLTEPDAAPYLPAILVGTLTACVVCEGVLVLLLAGLAPPQHAARPLHFWSGLLHCTSCFTVLTGAWGGPALHAIDTPPFSGRAGWLLAYAIFAWWVAALVTMILTRARPGPRRWLACVLVPAVGIAAIYGGFYASLGLGLLTYNLL